jgi:hypothetical protein
MALLLYAVPVSAQVQRIAWDRQLDPSVTGYVVTVDGAQIALTTDLTVPWTPTAAYHRVCVASRAGARTGAPACLDYGVPPVPPLARQPLPTTGTPSRSGTYATSLVDCSGAIWSIAPTRQTLRGAQHFGNGFADKLLSLNCVIYADTTTAGWWKASLSPDAWTLIASDPRVVVPPPARPPVPPATPTKTFLVAPKICVMTDTKPDERTGWGVQFKVDGVNVGGRDTSSPFSRDVPYVPGPHVYEAVWTKTNVPSVTRAVKAQGCS